MPIYINDCNKPVTSHGPRAFSNMFPCRSSIFATKVRRKTRCGQWVRSDTPTAVGGVAGVPHGDGEIVIGLGEEPRQADQQVAHADVVHLLEPPAAVLLRAAPMQVPVAMAVAVAVAVSGGVVVAVIAAVVVAVERLE